MNKERLMKEKVCVARMIFVDFYCMQVSFEGGLALYQTTQY